MKLGLLKLTALILSLLLPCSALATDYTQDANCEAAWLMTEGEGTTIADSSVNSNTGTFKASGQPAWSGSVPPGGFAAGSVDFNRGTADFISLTNALSTIDGKTASLVQWMSADSYDSFGIITFGTNTGTSVYWQIGNDTTVFLMADSLNITSTDFDSSTWFHIAWISDGTDIEFFADGVSKGSSGEAVTALSAGNKNFYIGDWIASPGSNWTYDGLLTEMALFSDALDSTEINDIMDNGLLGAAPTGWTHKWNGIPNANIAAINGVPKANIAKVNGV